MRTVLVFLTVILFLIVSLPLLLVFYIIKIFNKRACAIGSQAVIKTVFRFVLFLSGAKMQVRGQENIPADRPVLYVSNHRSFADIPMGYCTVKGPTGFIAKKEIRKVIILRRWMENMNCLFLNRSDLRQGLKTILTAVDNVKAGYSAFIMPEGTRNHEEGLLEFKEGSFKIAEKSGCPIIPVAISNADALLELHFPWVKKARVAISYGEPIETANMTKEDKKQICPKTVAVIERMLEEDREYINTAKK